MNRINSSYFWCFFLWLTSLQIGLSQPKNNILKDVSMPAPNVASLGKYGDIPVSYFTGVPNVSIPIYTVQEGALSLPISLSYHAAGVKVGEMASWVGLNWSLNAGGMISRTVMGIPDELNNRGYFYAAKRLLPPLTSGNLNATMQADSISAGNLDSEPDLFTFNVGGYSGKFTFDENKKVNFIPRADFKIEYNIQGSEIFRFILIAPDGTRYIFGTETTPAPISGIEYQTYDNAINSNIAPSSWYLVAIESHDLKNRIRLEYTPESYSYQSLSSWSNEGQGWTASGIDIAPYKKVNNSYINGRRLTSIYSSTAIVKFIAAGAVRTDLQGSASALSKIEIRNTQNPNLCYNFFEFYTTYFTSPGGSTSEYRRLRLDSLQEKSCDGTIVNPAYKLEYHPGNLPNRFSNAIDHWGFSNGALFNETTYNVPANGVLPAAPPYVLATANRESSYTPMVVGTIQKITYPTGGHTRFTFEANKVSTTSYNVVYQTVESTKYELTSCNLPPPGVACCNANVEVFKTFTAQDFNLNFPSELQTTVYMRLDLMNILNVSENPGSFRYCAPNGGPVNSNPIWTRIEIWRVSDNNLIFSQEFNLQATSSSGTWPQSPTQILASMLQLDVPYRIVLKTTNGRASFKLFRKETIATGGGSTVDTEVGGLRIKEMRHHDGINANNDIVKRFQYVESFGTTQSSGILYYRPVYMGTVTVEGIDAIFPFAMFFSTSITPMSAFHGYHVGYTKVWEENVGGGGRTLYQFNQAYSLYNDGLNPAYPIPPAEAQLTFGLQIASTQFSDAGTELAKSQTQYKNLSYTYLPGRIFKIFRTSGGKFSKTIYNIRTAPVLVASKTEILDGVSTTTDYQYDLNDRHLAPTIVSMINSDNKTSTTYNTYVHDMSTTQLALRDELINRNLIAQPIQSTIYVNSLQTGGNRLDYALFSNSTGLPNLSPSTATGHQPYAYQFYNYEMTWDSTGQAQTGNWELQATINKYDIATGKPAEMTHNNWSFPEKYTWDSNTKLILNRQFNNFFWSYTYEAGTRLVKSITDIDGQVVNYFYDPLQRLSEAQARSANVRNLYTYRYKGQGGASQNYVKTESIITQVDPANSAIGSRSAFQYLDGLGRPLQTVAQAASPTGKDVISAVAYDVLGRVVKEFTPYESTATTGAFVDVPTLAPNHPATLKTYESSPLGRVLSATPPGWYASTSAFGTNALNDAVLTGVDLVSVYAAGSLRKTTLSDPDGKKVITFTDKLGRAVLNRVIDANGIQTADTYTVYDDKNRVSKVVPPGASHFFTPDLVFTYRYDGGDRIIAKKVPDAARTFIQYNNRDFPALSYLPKEGKWLGTIYDVYGRPTQVGFVTGLAASPPNPNSFTISANDLLSETIYDGQTGGGITRTATAIDKGRVTTTRSRILGASDFLTSTNFYDSYGRPATIRQNNHLSLPITAASSPETITRTYDMADNLLTENRAHSIGTGTDRTLRSKSTYDSQGRLKESHFDPGTGVFQKTGLLNYNHRNEIIERNLGYYPSGDRYLQSLDYTYNPQGWLTAINQNPLGGANISLYFPPQLPNPGTPSTIADQNDLFSMELKYDNPLTGYEIPAQPQKNGNISQLWWRVRGRATEAWGLEYDYLNRLTQAKHVAADDGGAKIMGQYSEKITYADARGNIAAIQRYGVIPGASYPSGMIDDLSFTIKPGSNQLQRVADAAPAEFAPRGFKPTAGAQNIDYTYDPVGNQKSDPHKGITITYNYLNLPSVILWSNGNKMEISYDAVGTKLSKKVSIGATEQYTQHYLGGIEYNAVGTTRKLEAIYFTDGRVYNTNVTTTSTTVVLRYEYAIRDHLGNTRLMFADQGTTPDGVISATEILQENHYYPFGMNMEGAWMNDAASKDSKYQYNGKELNDDFGLGWSDYGARWYDAGIGRWGQVDPISEKYLSICPYNYVSNNPIIAVDPDGQRIIFVNGYLGFGSPKGGDVYWNGSNSDFVRGAKRYLGDEDVFFTDIKHISYSTANSRIEAGEKWAMENYKELIKGLDKEKDDFKFVTHSMGAAFAEGVSRHLKFMGWNVTQAIHFEPFQANGFTADTNPPGYGTDFNTTIATNVIDYQLTNDPVLNYIPTSNRGKLDGSLVSIRETGQSELEYRHREPIDSGKVWEDLSRLIYDALKRGGTTIINFKN